MLVYITTIYIFIKTICLDTYMHVVVIIVIVIVDIIFSNKIKIKLKCMKYIYKHNVLCMYVCFKLSLYIKYYIPFISSST